MPINSRDKGARGERAARDYLRSLGFEGVIRGQQRSGVEQADVVGDALSNVHVEVKYGYPLSAFDLHLELLWEATHQAIRDSGIDREWVVLWKPYRHRQWRMTFYWHGLAVTVADDESIRCALLALQTRPDLPRRK